MPLRSTSGVGNRHVHQEKHTVWTRLKKRGFLGRYLSDQMRASCFTGNWTLNWHSSAFMPSCARRISSSSSSFYHNTSQQPVAHLTDQLLLLVFLPQHITAASGTLDGSAPPPRLSTTTHHSSQWYTRRISSSSSSFYHNTSQQPVVHSTDQLLLLVFLPQHITAASGTLRRQFSCMQYASTLSYLCNQTPVMECVCSWTLDSSYKFDYHCYHQYYPLQSHRIMWPFWLFISLFVCMFVCKITRKVAGRLGWSFQGKFILG